MAYKKLESYQTRRDEQGKYLMDNYAEEMRMMRDNY